MASAQSPGYGGPPPGYGEFPPGYGGPPPGYGQLPTEYAAPLPQVTTKSKFCNYGTCACIADIVVTSILFLTWLGLLGDDYSSLPYHRIFGSYYWGLPVVHLLGLGPPITYLVLAIGKTNRDRMMLRVSFVWLIWGIIRVLYDLILCIAWCVISEIAAASRTKSSTDGIGAAIMIMYIVGEVFLVGGYIAIFVFIGLNMRVLWKAIDAAKRNEGTGAANFENTQN